MAEGFLNDIFHIARTISKIEELIDLARFQESDDFVNGYNAVIQEVWDFGNTNVREFLTQMGKSRDIVYLADMLESCVLPEMIHLAGELAEIAVDVDDAYVIQSTQSGYLTLYNRKTNQYLHSNNSPMDAARRNISHQYDPSKSHYSVWGIGLGYELYQLYLASEGSIHIDAYEMSEVVFECALKYGVLDAIPEDVVTYHIGTTVEAFLQEPWNRENGKYIHLPSAQAILDKNQRELLLGHYMQVYAFSRFQKQYEVNVYRNRDYHFPWVSGIEYDCGGKDIVVVAAGPSLNLEMDTLRHLCGEKLIFAVGTVFKKLMLAGIVPDYVFVNDPLERTTRQFDGMWEQQVPLVIDAAANWRFGKNYQGPKSIAWTVVADWIDHGTSVVQQLTPLPSCRTVTNFAIDCAIRFHPSRIILVGADMSFPNGESHASGTMDYHKVNNANLHEVPSNGGGMVFTDLAFEEYRKELEIRVSLYKDIDFVNTSLGGVRIAGARYVALKDC